MSKRAVDLSVEELAAMGGKAARLAARKSQAAGQVVTGTVDTFEGGKAISSLAQLHPSGTVTLVRKSDGGVTADATVADKPARTRTSD